MATSTVHLKKTLVDNDSTIDPAKYLINRQTSLALEKASGINHYPNKFAVSFSVTQFIEAYSNLNTGERIETHELISLAGRIMGKRASSSKLLFYDLHGDGAKVQVIADTRHSGKDYKKFIECHSRLKRGDIIGISGFPGKSNNGELSIFARSIELLAPCLHMLPRHVTARSGDEEQNKKSERQNSNLWNPGMPRNPETYTLNNQESRYRQRYLDLIMNPDIRQVFITRGRILSYYRNFLDKLGFLEVETPIMNMTHSGASARPFVTYHNELEIDSYMRVSPELNLKKLVIGGLDRVYEIGKQFRNEGIDLTHLPEFTMCELYMAYQDYYDLIGLTEKLLSGMIMELTGSYKIKYHGNGLCNEPIEIDFTPPFRRIDFMEELEKMGNLDIPKDLYSEEANKYLLEACERFNVNCPSPRTTARLLDKLVGHFVEETCVNPTFIMNHPVIMSPLAKGHRTRPGFTERFELFVNKRELCNAYTELNDPEEQSKRFMDQHKDRESGDDEAMVLDKAFCTALEYGLPPTAGMGMGIDRLTMLITDSHNVKEVILYPPMKPKEDNSQIEDQDRENVDAQT